MLPFPTTMSGPAGLGAAFGKKAVPAAPPKRPPSPGLPGVRQKNASNVASLGLTVDKAGNQLTNKTQLGTGSLAGQSTRASGLPASPPAPAATTAAVPALTPQGGAAPAPQSFMGPVQNGRQAEPVPGGLLPVPQLQRPAAPATAPLNGPVPGQMVPAPDEPGPDEALTQFADAEMGAMEWQNQVNGPRRGLRARGGAYNGMTQPQALSAVENKFRGLSPERKQQFHERGKGLRHTPDSLRSPSL